MNTRSKGKPKLTLKQFRLTLLARDSTVAAFARSIGRSRRAVYGAFATPNQFGPTWQLIQEAVDA